jgi:hypothetical protein
VVAVALAASAALETAAAPGLYFGDGTGGINLAALPEPAPSDVEDGELPCTEEDLQALEAGRNPWAR